MALSSALFTGLSGLDVNQARLNVVGNNIANANTVAFKSSRALFKPQFYVTEGGGTPPSAEFGGTNPSQRGLGAQVAAIEKDFSPGSIDPTGKPTDMAIDGSGFFVVKSDKQSYTRDGSFSLNGSNELVTSAGEFVQGYAADKDGNIQAGALSNLTIPLGTTTTAQATGNVTLEGNLNANGAVANGASVLSSQAMTTVAATAPVAGTLLTDLRDTSSGATLYNVGDTLTLAGDKGGRGLPPATLDVTPATTLGDLQTFFNGGLGIDTTVPAVPGNPTPGTTIDLDGTDPNSVHLVVTGNTGSENALALTGTAFSSSSGSAPMTFADGTNAAGFASNPTGESVHTSFVGYDSLGTPVTVDVTAALESKTSAGNTWRFYVQSGDDTDTNLVVGNGTLTFGTDGKLLDSTGTTVTLDRVNTGASTPTTINLDFNNMTSLTASDSQLVMTAQDGSPLGTLNSYSIGADGTITGAFSNGKTKSLGQVAIATFDNPNGLVDNGGNKFTEGPNSGVAVVAAPLTLGGGAIRSGALEASNVDISKEFINMIISSTGFSASSRVISTSDQLITELLNSAR
jgi:flagellar hook protein FlgE